MTKTIEFINGDSLYKDKFIEIVEGEDDVEFYEVDKDCEIPKRLLDKMTVKWIAENGRINPYDVKDYIDVTIKKEPVIVKKKTKKVNQEMLYTGRSKKITSKMVTVISINGNKCKVKDASGNEVVVAKSTLKDCWNGLNIKTTKEEYYNLMSDFGKCI